MARKNLHALAARVAYGYADEHEERAFEAARAKLERRQRQRRAEAESAARFLPDTLPPMEVRQVHLWN